MSRLTALLLTVVTLSGCYNPFDPPADIAIEGDAPTGKLLAPAAEGKPRELPDTLTLPEALAWGWRSHPAMNRVRHLVLARHGYKAQAALWPNPVIGGAFQEEPGKKTRGIVSLAQKFEIGGKADARVSVATANIFLGETELIET